MAVSKTFPLFIHFCKRDCSVCDLEMHAIFILELTLINQLYIDLKLSNLYISFLTP